MELPSSMYPLSKILEKLKQGEVPTGIHPHMNGNFVFRNAVIRFGEVIKETLKAHNLSASDLDLYIPHQANLRISQFIQKKFRLNDDQVFNNIMKYGNTTAATGKGFAIASAALTSLALFAAYVTFTGIDGINIFKAPVLAMLFVGGMIPVVFSALAMNSVGKAAMDMVYEVRRQFKEIPGIMEGTGKPQYDKCVAISTNASIKKMMLPGAIAIISPIVIGFLLGPEVLGGFLAGATVSGVLMGMFQNNAGGAWDNAKKSFEKGVEINGKMEYKKSEPHKASVTGDTVGDPFKDTSGPSMNILIKLMSIVSLVIAPTLSGIFHDNIQQHRIEKMETMMQACHKAGCTPEECEQVMGTTETKACCADTTATDATATPATPSVDTAATAQPSN